MKVFIVGFDKLSSIKKESYIDLQIGAEISQKSIAKLKDNKGDNISKKNPNYCELTGLYWIWKNVKENVVGLVHYRRFFYKNCIVFNKKNVLSEKTISKVLEQYDFILPQEGHLFKKRIYDQYKGAHDIEDLEKCGEIIKQKYPDYYDIFHKVIYSNHYHPYNMFIGKKELIDKYCEWLFSIFDELENYIDLDKKSKYNKRVYGFISERLFNVWLLKNNCKTKEYPVYNVELPMLKQELIAIIKKIIF